MKELKADSIELEFDGRKILRSVYLTCRQGEVIGLLGRNGCGKSTMLKVIFGVQQAGHKYVAINGEYISKGYHNNRIAYLPQHNYLPAGVQISKLAKLLVDPELWSDFTQLEIFKNHAHKTVGQLSGGEQRQLETMMIVHSRADFILLDEPFTHVSPIHAEELKPIIRKCAKTKGIIVTDHQYRNILDVSDRIILLHNGETRHIKESTELVEYGYISGL